MVWGSRSASEWASGSVWELVSVSALGLAWELVLGWVLVLPSVLESASEWVLGSVSDLAAIRSVVRREVVSAVALEAESPEVELEFLAPELEGAVSESMIPDWFLGIPPLPGCC
jgi:hypothetical protein